MTKEDYVSLDCAKLLKGKGFKEPCLAYYFDDEFMLVSSPWRGENIESLRQNTYLENSIDAPTLHEAQTWIRQNYLINIVICCNWDRANKYFYAMNICQDDCNVDMKCKDTYPTYESALNAGIIEALKIIGE